MQPRRQKWIARLLLGAGLALAAVWLGRLDYARKISTDVLDLIPSGERAPELALARSLASERQARVALFAISAADAAQRAAAARVFADALRGSPAFAEVVAMGDTGTRDALGREVFGRRFDLLLPGWLAARRAEFEAAGGPGPWPQWLAEQTVARLEAFLGRPEAVAFGELLPADPLLLLPELLEQMQGFAEPSGDTGGYALVWARTREPPLSPEGQGPVLEAVAQALAAARGIAPDAGLKWAAISRFAAENRERIRQEMSGLNLLTLVAVLGVAALGIRHVLKVLHLAPVLICAMLGAWTAVTMAFGRVHVLVFVVGSLLGGVAVDYGFYLYLQPPLRSGEPYRDKVRRLLEPLLASALTTVLGFSLLLFSDLPLIRQLGVFVSAGLLAALAAALLWFAQVEKPFAETRAFARARPREVGPRLRGGARLVLIAAAIVAVAGQWRLRWHDDIRDLEALTPGLREEARQVRALFGDKPARTAYLTRGATLAGARDALTGFLAWHAEAFPGRPVATLGFAVPAPADFENAGRLAAGLREFPEALRTALAARDFDPAEFTPFFDAWSAWAGAPRPDFETVVRAFAETLRGPVALTMTAGAEASWFVTVAEHPAGAEPPAETGTIALDQLQSLNRLFLRYRVSALWLSACGLGLVGLSVFAIYGWRRGLPIFALPSGACLFAFGLLGLAGHPLNLFHLLGAFLGVCLSHNYAIFTAENARRGENQPPSIRLSAATTAASFGVLACSQIAAVSALGTTVAIIVLSALAGVEIVPLARRRSGPKKTGLAA